MGSAAIKQREAKKANTYTACCWRSEIREEQTPVDIIFRKEGSADLMPSKSRLSAKKQSLACCCRRTQKQNSVKRLLAGSAAHLTAEKCKQASKTSRAVLLTIKVRY